MTLLIEGHNIGKVLELKLHSIGIDTIESLRSVGTEEAFRRLREIDKNCSRAILFAIEGAIQGVRWHKLEEYRKNELRAFYADINNEYHY